MRKATVNRKTAETDICLSLCLDGGAVEVCTGCGFFDHMLELFGRHSSFGLELRCTGDLHVDCHHTVEDVGICLGRAFSEAIGDKRGIYRYGSIILPMDETLILAAADISGRGGLYASLDIPTERVGDFDTQLCEEFFTAFARESGVTLHIRQLAGANSHHIIEGVFKAVGRCLAAAAAIDTAHSDAIPSTKGVL